MAKDMIERLKKIRELALRGVPGGEKEAAQALLDKLMKKNGISLSDIEDDTPVENDFTYHGAEQRRILMQTIYKVMGNVDEVYLSKNSVTGRTCRTKFVVICTPAQAVEINFLFDFYSALWEREKDMFLRAFIQKHRLFGNRVDNIKSDKMSDEEIEKMLSMMGGLSDVSPHKGIESHVSATKTK